VPTRKSDEPDKGATPGADPAADPTTPDEAVPSPPSKANATTNREEAGSLSASAASLLGTVDGNALLDHLIDRLLKGSPRYTPAQIAEASGVERSVSRRLWRAMGLADVPDDVVAFTDLDLEALERTKVLVGQGDIQIDLIVQLARVLGLSTARIADSIVDFTLDRLATDAAGDAGASDASSRPNSPDQTGAPHQTGVPQRMGADDPDKAKMPLVNLLLEELDALVIYLLHRHLVDATARRLSTVGHGAASTNLAVGFADLVGFTALSQEVSDDQIVRLIERFETLSSNEVVAAGGRIIKMIGDEVMFSADESAGPEVALRLTETFTDPELPSLRVGLASGPVVSRSGDLFGPVVNLAARATAIAHPGSVVVSASIRDQLAGDERYTLRRLRPRRLKGLGFVELNVLRRAKGHEADPHDDDPHDAPHDASGEEKPTRQDLDDG
jgi:adenylate cyclase